MERPPSCKTPHRIIITINKIKSFAQQENEKFTKGQNEKLNHFFAGKG